jgi:hypothetical protein
MDIVSHATVSDVDQFGQKLSEGGPSISAMKILTATTKTQGARFNDFTWTTEGELVWFGIVCARDERNPDGGCGCGRAFAGLNSHRATTTAIVTDLPMTRDDVATALAGYYQSAGYGTYSIAELMDEVTEVLDMVDSWDVGDVIERRLDFFQPRAAADASRRRTSD